MNTTNPIPNLNIQIIWMDKAYLESGEDYRRWEEENKESLPQPLPPIFWYDNDGLVCFNLPSPCYFYFDHSITPTQYEYNQEFTDAFKNSQAVSVLYFPAGTFGAIIKIK